MTTGASGASLLAGNGVALVRERALASAVQRSLERLYQIDGELEVEAFLHVADEGERETLFVREAQDGALELALRVPNLGAREMDAAGSDLDPLCQLIEGVSHFVYIAERARAGREATQLELEVQAEVDKYVVLAASVRALDVRRSEQLRTRLYGDVSFAHDPGTEHGDRYRLANEAASKIARRLERDYVAGRRFAEMRSTLRRFFRMGQEDKLRFAR